MERWFMNRRKNKVLDIAYRQMTLALDTVNDLENAIQAISARDLKTARIIIERLFKVEEEIDELRQTVFEELTKGNVPHQEREDIMHLVKRLDVMADNVKNSARNVLSILETDIPDAIFNAFHKMVRSLVETAVVLRNSLKNLSDNPYEARRFSEEVEVKENKVDKDFLDIKKLLIKHGNDMNPWVLILLKDLLDSIEEAADACADTGDYIRVLTVPFKQ
jgi:predicted phosphate transport protein (TIGR00153 family)